MSVKEELMEIVKNAISQEKLTAKLNESIMKIAQDMLDTEHEGNIIYSELQGCQYDSYIDNISDFSEIMIDEDDGETVNELARILKDNYSVCLYEYFEDFDKVDLTIEEAILGLDNSAKVREYDKFYPLNGQFKSLDSSDKAMFVIELKQKEE